MWQLVEEKAGSLREAGSQALPTWTRFYITVHGAASNFGVMAAIFLA